MMRDALEDLFFLDLIMHAFKVVTRGDLRLASGQQDVLCFNNSAVQGQKDFDTVCHGGVIVPTDSLAR